MGFIASSGKRYHRRNHHALYLYREQLQNIKYIVSYI